MQAQYRNLGTQGSVLRYKNVVHKFSLGGVYEGEIAVCPSGFVDVNVVSIAVFGGSCEIGINVGQSFKKYRSKLSTPDVVSSALSRGNFYTAVLRRNVPLGGQTVSQMLIVCNSSVNPFDYLTHLMLEEVR